MLYFRQKSLKGVIYVFNSVFEISELIGWGFGWAENHIVSKKATCLQEQILCDEKCYSSLLGREPFLEREGSLHFSHVTGTLQFPICFSSLHI